MYTNKAMDGRRNICGKQITRLRTSMNLSQRELADQLQVAGLDIGKNVVQRIESGARYVPDFELIFFSRVLDVEISQLLLPDNTDNDAAN